MSETEQVIPDGEVWKFIYEVSHAPHYVQQLQCRDFVGIFAPVENVDRENSLPFGVDVERVHNERESETVTVLELDKENSPFAEGTYHDQVIPDGTVWAFDMNDGGGLHYVHQLANGTFLLQYEGTLDDPPVGLSKEKVLTKKHDDRVDVASIAIEDSPFRKQL